jgi:hypothetical protein
MSHDRYVLAFLVVSAVVVMLLCVIQFSWNANDGSQVRLPLCAALTGREFERCELFAYAKYGMPHPYRKQIAPPANSSTARAGGGGDVKRVSNSTDTLQASRDADLRRLVGRR